MHVSFLIFFLFLFIKPTARPIHLRVSRSNSPDSVLSNKLYSRVTGQNDVSELIFEYRCSRCSRRFSTRYILVRHQVDCEVEKPFACEICRQRFTRLYNLRHHQKKTGHSMTSYIDQERTAEWRGRWRRRIRGRKRNMTHRPQHSGDNVIIGATPGQRVDFIVALLFHRLISIFHRRLRAFPTMKIKSKSRCQV